MRHALTALLAVACALLSGCSTVTSGTPKAAAGSAGPARSTAPGPTCRYMPTPDEPSAKPVGLPAPSTSDPLPTSLALETSQGRIGITLVPTGAGCTVHSIAFLARRAFYDGSACHRLTSSDSLKVLQCGDPTATGTGGPGYTVPDENPTGLSPSPQLAGAVIYPRGTVAMANTGQPDSGGSQFFLVYADSTLPPTYAVFGKVDDAGLAVLDKIAAGGVGGGGQDGAPASTVVVTRAVVGS